MLILVATPAWIASTLAKHFYLHLFKMHDLKEYVYFTLKLFVMFHIVSTVFFDQSTYSVPENVTTIKLTLNLSKPLSRDINITVVDNSSTATGK